MCGNLKTREPEEIEAVRSQLTKIEYVEKLLKTRIDRDNAATASTRGPPSSPGGKRIRVRSKSKGAAPS
jgi:hypothetical protein